MFYRTIFVYFVGSILVKLVKADPNSTEITFTIEAKKNESNIPYLTCDHNDDSKQTNKYTVLEGGTFEIITNYNNFVNHFSCSDYSNNARLYKHVDQAKPRNVTTFTAEKNMGTIWICTVLTNRGTSTLQPVVLYEDETYTAVYCYMQIHVRQTNPPQTILVNNMVLQAVRADLSERDVDFTAEYQYIDGDKVKVACVNSLTTASLTMEYPIADKLSDKFTSRNLLASQAIGFATKLHSGHNNSYMICTDAEPSDYTKVMVRFVMRTEINIITIKINGETLRPKFHCLPNNNYMIEYKYIKNLPITVVCEVERQDMKLVSGDSPSNSVKELKKLKQGDMSLQLSGKNRTLFCGADSSTGASAENIEINFSEGKFPIERPVHMELPPNGTVMELYDYSDENSRKVIFYEFEDGERLQLKCGPLHSPLTGPVLYLLFNDSPCKVEGCYVTQNLTLTDQLENSAKVCRLMEEELEKGSKDKVLKEIRVILRKRVLTTTSTTTTTTTTTTSTTTDQSADHQTAVQPSSEEKGTAILAVIAGAVVCIIVICVSIIIIRLRKRNHSQGGPHDRNYENLATPSETSIPAFPPQWESNYAVPVDRRTDDTTYSVPCHEQLYSTPTPKKLRNKKQKPVEPTYAVLDMPNAQGRKNVFKETDDPNYSEVYANRQEQCYAKVLPKSVRNKVVQDNNPYSYVTNEPSYANTGEPEPMYCEPAKAAGGLYANLNNSHYVNSNAQEYVEPTYCEPQKLRK